jgi:hypothetical protein
MEPISIESPDHTKVVMLEYDGEARFGPAFFRAKGVGFPWALGPTVVVGEDVHWSADSRYVVILVFLSRDTSRAPVVELLAVDTIDGGTITIDQNPRGLIHLGTFCADGTYRYTHVKGGVAEDKIWKPPLAFPPSI